jgi:hypothetical protein
MSHKRGAVELHVHQTETNSFQYCAAEVQVVVSPAARAQEEVGVGRKAYATPPQTLASPPAEVIKTVKPPTFRTRKATGANVLVRNQHPTTQHGLLLGLAWKISRWAVWLWHPL